LIYSKLSFVFILLCVDDVSKIALERDQLIMGNIDKTGTRLTSKAKRSFCYPTMVPRPAGCTLDDEDENCSDVITDLSQSQPQTSKKRTYAELDKVYRPILFYFLSHIQ
jgi:hypothetical protein